MRPHVINRLTVHHSAVVAAGGDGARRLRSYQDLHMDGKGWPDIAYHVAVDRDGLVWELRSVDVVGDTATSYDPTGHFLLLLDGNFEEQQPSARQFEAAASVLAWASRELGAGLESISGHRDHAATSCPGEHLHGRLGELRELAASRLAAGVALERVC